ncbi:MBL fold metallo-hydrolase [Planctobacterium marinum]|uniref:hypothetical protein n=1 Tax=Planctobacterium marinum TaxID=1631968 RepID=UPI001E34AD85|nr:hypothetical protein [Planctobacterium marinum]MCC2604891.1 hypothetical protein [Planctobacterium marinum]
MKVKMCLTTVCLVLGLTAFSGIASENNVQLKKGASDKVLSIIDKLVMAYGGAALLQANSIKVVDYNKGPWPGESELPDVPELWRINEELTIDYKNQRKSLLSYRVPRTTLDLEKWVQQGDSTIMYDILHEKYSEESWANFDRLGASLERSSDTLQARRLARLSSELEFNGEEYYRGRLQQKLILQHASGERYTYFVDSTSGLIYKILRQHPRAGDMLYIFSNHNIAAKLPYARDMNFFVNGQLRLSSVHRYLELNPELSAAFSGFDHFTPWGATIDASELTAKKLSAGVFQAGKGRALTVFIEQADHYIAMGAAEALTENFYEIKKLSMQDKPLKYFVVTHHHNANVRGLDNALELGATLVVAMQHKDTILKYAAGAQPDQLLLVPERVEFTLGDLKLFDIATAHSQHYLLAYLPSVGMVLAEDHYVTELKTAKPRIYHDMVRFAQAIDALKLDVKTLVDIRGWRQFSWIEFRQWTRDFKPKTCPAGFDICANG